MADESPAEKTTRDVVLAAREGDGEAFGALYSAYVDQVFDVARRIVRDPGIAAEVTQDTFVAAYQRLGSLRDPDTFGGWLLRIGRNRALDRWARERRSTTTDPADRLMTDQVHPDDEPAVLAQRKADAAMLWAAAEVLGDADTSLLHLHLRHGLEAAELADELGVAPNAVHQRLFRLRKRLGSAIGAWQLWRNGRPRCPELEALLREGHPTGRFNAVCARIIEQHAGACAVCDTERERSTSPEVLFAAVPVLAVPAAAKADIATALVSAGIPLPPHLTAREAGDAGSRAGPADDTRRERQRRSVLLTLAAMLILLLGIALWAALGTGHPASVVEDAGSPRARDSAISGTGSTATGQPSAVTRTADASRTPMTQAAPRTTTGDAAPGQGADPARPRPSRARQATPSASSVSSGEARSATTARPVILRFTASRIARPDGCREPADRIVVRWATEEASRVTLTLPDGSQPVRAEGSLVACSAGPARFALTAVGPGGHTSAGPLVVD